MKKFISLILACCVVMGMLPLTVFAAASVSYTYTVSNGEATITDASGKIRGNITIPSTLGGYPVTSIGDRVFEGCGQLTSINIPDSVTSIGSYAFESCVSLTNINIPDSVTHIESWAFSDCTGLESVYITDIVTWCNITFDSSYSNPLCYAKNLYFNDELVTDLVIPDGVTRIANYAFHSCESLTSIIIPSSVTSIGHSAFYDCSNLEGVTIQDGVTSIGGSAFLSCISLTSINIPDSVTSIGTAPFAYCTSLNEISVGENNTAYTSVNGVLFNKNVTKLVQYPIGNTANNYIIPDSVTSIGSYAFHLCTSLTNIDIPNGVTSIGQDAFNGCTQLTSVTIPNSVTSIGSYAFRDCYGLTSVDISNGVTSIGPYAFGYCKNLTSLNIPNSVTSIGWSAFESCKRLTSVTIYTRNATFGSGAFSNAHANFTIHGYAGSTAEAYASKNGYKFVLLDDEPLDDVPPVEYEEHDITIEVRDATTQKLIPDSQILLYTNADDGEFYSLKNGRITLENVSFPIHRLGVNASRYDGLPTMKNVSYPEDGKIVFYLVPSDSRKVPVEGVDIWGFADKLYVGETYQLKADVLPFYASDKNITWSSSDTSIATVDSTGLVTAKNGGNVKITAISTNGKSDSYTFTVNNVKSLLNYDNYGYKFDNSSTSFGYGLFYKIPKERYLQLGATEELAKQLVHTWGGNCFGMSLSSILFYKNILIEQRYNQDITFPIQFAKPNAGNNAFLNDKWEVKLRHMIELFQVSQYLSGVDRPAFHLDSVVQQLDAGNPVAFDMYEKDKNGNKKNGHTVVIYGYTKQYSTYTFYIYDCSGYVNKFIYTNDQNWELNYTQNGYNWSIFQYITFDTMNSIYEHLVKNNYNDAISLFSNRKPKTYTYVFRQVGNMQFINSEGQESIIKNGDIITGFDDIRVMPSSYLDDNPTYTIILPTDTYTIIGEGDEVITTTLANDYMSVEITAKASIPVTISSDLHTVTIDNDSESDYSVKYTTYDNIFDEMTVSGISENEVTVSLEDTNVTVSGAKTVTAVATRSEVPTEISAEIPDGQTAVIECTETASGGAELKITAGNDSLTDTATLSTRAKVEMPGYDLESGEYTSGQTLTLSKDDDTVIYYTIDGSYPSADNGMLYTMPITVNQSMTVMAISTKYGYENSDILTLEYTLPEVDVPFVTLPEGEHIGLQQVDILADEDASIYYTIDGSDPLNGGTLYTHPIILREDTTLKVYADINGCISAVHEYNYVVSNADELAFDDIIIADEMVKVNITSNVNKNGVLKVTCYNPIDEVIEEKYCDITLMANVVNSQYVEIDTRCATKISASLLDSEDNSILLCDDFSKDFPLRTVDSGECGDLEWVLYYTGEMTITGTGAMCDYSYDSVPWYYNRNSINKVTIGDGVTTIGRNAFSSCENLTSVIFPESMKIIPSGAFGECDNLRSATFYSRDVEFGSEVFTDIWGDPIENLEIYGYTGSTVEAYASENGHTFVALPEITTVVEKTSMILGNDLSIMFAFTADDIVGESNYAVITKTYADGTASRTEQIEQTAWGEPIVINGKNYYAISFSGVAAKEMTDKVQVQIFNEDGKAISEVFTDSIRDYAMRMIENGTNVRMFVDMLVYGAEAQKQFDNYAGNDLATSQLTAEQLAQATPTVNCKNNLVANDNYRASSLILENNIKLLFLFAGIDPTMTATIAYEDHYGNTQNIIVEGTNFAPVTYQGENCYSITVDKLVVADARQLVSVVVNDADGNEIASASDSVESYIARMSTTGTLYESILKFADSAAAILHNYN